MAVPQNEGIGWHGRKRREREMGCRGEERRMEFHEEEENGWKEKETVKGERRVRKETGVPSLANGK